jgi:hypothetical protein
LQDTCGFDELAQTAMLLGVWKGESKLLKAFENNVKRKSVML